MNHTGKRLVQNFLVLVLLVFSLLLVACAESQETTREEDISVAEEIRKSGVEVDSGTDVGNLPESPQSDNFIQSLAPSRYSDRDFDTTGAVLFQTEYPVIDKGMENICYTIENNSGKDLEYGSEYVLEFQKDEQWYEVPFPENAAFDSVAYLLQKDHMSGGILNLNWMDFTYVDGQYRIVKQIGDYLLKAEFSMGESAITPETPFGYAALEELPAEYNIDNAIADGVVVFGYRENYNTERFKTFLIKAKLGLPAMVRIGFSTCEGDPVFYDIKRNVTEGGMEWYTLYHDSCRDMFSAEKDRVITERNYSYLVTDGETIFLSNFAEYREEEKFFEESRSLVYIGSYIGEYYDKGTGKKSEKNIDTGAADPSGQEMISLVEELTEKRLKGNTTRYKSFSPGGSYYVCLNEEQLNGSTSFGYGTKGYGISDYEIPAENSEQTYTAEITGILRVYWLDEKTAKLVCTTEKENLYCYVEFRPQDAMEGIDAFGEREYMNVFNIQ